MNVSFKCLKLLQYTYDVKDIEGRSEHSVKISDSLYIFIITNGNSYYVKHIRTFRSRNKADIFQLVSIYSVVEI